MSGGHFNYAYARISQFADELEEELQKDADLQGVQTKSRLWLLVFEARRISQYMRAAEWYFSGDISEYALMERMDTAEGDFLGELEKNKGKL